MGHETELRLYQNNGLVGLLYRLIWKCVRTTAYDCHEIDSPWVLPEFYYFKHYTLSIEPGVGYEPRDQTPSRQQFGPVDLLWERRPTTTTGLTVLESYGTFTIFHNFSDGPELPGKYIRSRGLWISLSVGLLDCESEEPSLSWTVGLAGCVYRQLCVCQHILAMLHPDCL